MNKTLFIALGVFLVASQMRFPVLADEQDAIPAESESPADFEDSDVLKSKLDRIREEYSDELFIEFYSLGRDVAHVEDKARRVADAFQEKRETVKSLAELLKNLDDQIDQTQDRQTETIEAIRETVAAVSSVTDDINERTRELEGQRELFGVYLNRMYEQANLTTLEILLREETFADALNETYNLEVLEYQGRELYDYVIVKVAALEKQKITLQDKHLELKALQITQEDLLTQLETRREQKEYLLEVTKGEEELYQQLLTEAKEEIRQADEELDSLKDIINSIQDEDGKRKLRALEAQFSNGFSESNGTGLIWPVDPEEGITAYFHDEEYRQYFGMPHQGVDIRAGQGSDIRAAQDGYVYRAADNGLGYSNIILVHNRELMTVYGHISQINVSEGDLVRKGDVIGRTGGRPGTKGAGRMTTGPHLHFEVRKDSTPVDPFDYLP